MSEYKLRLLDRIVAVLDCFTSERPRWALSQLEKELPLSKSTTFRILQGLEQHKIVQYDSASQQYILGPRILQFSQALVQQFNLRDAARPFLEQLRDSTGETAALFIRMDDRRLCIDQVESKQSIRRVLPVGVPQPIYPSTTGKLFLAYEDPGRARTILSNMRIQAVTSHTIVDLKEILEELIRVRQQGYSTSIEESLAGAWTIAAPIRQADGKVEWAMTVSGPMPRYSEEKFTAAITAIVEAARAVERQLGHEPATTTSNGSRLVKERVQGLSLVTTSD